MIDFNKKIGFVNSGGGIGDKIQFSSLPENFFLATGKKLIDVSKSWVFDTNPYVDRDIQPDIIIDLWGESIRYNERISPHIGDYKFWGVSHKACGMFGIPCTIRHPRLYRYEDEEIDPCRIVVHTNAISEGGIMPDCYLEQVIARYKYYHIIQVGGKNDRNTPNPIIDFRGASIEESIKLIAGSAMFIGVNSSMMNIANCYPRVRKKIALTQFSEEQLKSFEPASLDHSIWLDYNCEYYTPLAYDVGCTMSYKKI